MSCASWARITPTASRSACGLIAFPGAPTSALHFPAWTRRGASSAAWYPRLAQHRANRISGSGSGRTAGALQAVLLPGADQEERVNRPAKGASTHGLGSCPKSPERFRFCHRRLRKKRAHLRPLLLPFRSIAPCQTQCKRNSREYPMSSEAAYTYLAAFADSGRPWTKETYLNSEAHPLVRSPPSSRYKKRR